MIGLRPIAGLRSGSRMAAAVLLAAIVTGTAGAQTSTIGRTWPIAEPDALAEIEAKAASLPADMSKEFGPRSRWSAMRSASLASASATRTRTVIPFYTLDMDVRLPDGRVLYPRGYTFNPLDYVTLAQRLIIIHPAELRWALSQAAPTDWIVLAAPVAKSAAAPDPIALGRKLDRPIFLLEQRIKDRLGLTVAPVIVRQVGRKLELDEFRLPQRRRP